MADYTTEDLKSLYLLGASCALVKADVSAEEADKVMDLVKKDWRQLLAEWRREFRLSRTVRKEKIEKRAAAPAARMMDLTGKP